MATAEKDSFPFNSDQEFELKFGNSFSARPGPKNAFHTIRYDFKPASVDTSRPAELVVGTKNDITVTVPHIQDSGTTVYKGSKRACPKEFILVVDKDTKTFTLERIASTVPQLKRIRSSGKTPKAVPAVPKKQQPTSQPSTTTNPSPVPAASAAPSSSQETISPQKTAAGALSADSNSESSLSDSSSDSEKEQKDDDDDDDDDEVAAEDVQELDNILMNQNNQSSSNGPEFTHLLNDDLQLSESGSDSD